MKKITLSKQTLRVLTAQETGQVAGGRPPTLHPCVGLPSEIEVCDTTEGGCTGPSVGCPPPTAGCPPPSAGCTSPTVGCPPNETNPTRSQGHGPCAFCPIEP